jgi:NAD(P) transhydrogenase
VLIACGTRPARQENIPFDGKRVLDADELPWVQELPRDIIVVGAGVIGLEYASMLTAMNIEVTLIDQRPTILEFVDAEIIEALSYHMRRLGTTFRLGEKVTGVEIDEKNRVLIHTESGKRAHAQALLYTVGRQSNADLLEVGNTGLEVDSRGRLAVNEHYQTTVPHIYAVGDVIGFPALASTAMEQGRLASCHMFKADGPNGAGMGTMPSIPYGIYTIPEISMVGKTEKELTAAGVPYETGVAKFEELAKGQIAGDASGILKLIFHPDTLELLGVHVIGESAAEIIHIGQAVLTHRGKIDYFRDAVFNYPTFAEAYKVAAFDGLNKL